MKRTPPNKAREQTRRGRERERGALVGPFHGCAAIGEASQSARTSQLIASVRPTLRVSEVTEAAGF